MRRTYTIRLEIQAVFSKKVNIRHKAKDIAGGLSLPEGWTVSKVASRCKVEREQAPPVQKPPTDEEIAIQRQLSFLREVLADLHRIRPNVTTPWLEVWPNRWCQRPYARMPRGAHAHQNSFWVVSRNPDGITTGRNWKAAKGLICINPKQILRTMQYPIDDPVNFGALNLMAHEFAHLVVPARAHRSAKFNETVEALMARYKELKAGTWTPPVIVPGWEKANPPLAPEVVHDATHQ